MEISENQVLKNKIFCHNLLASYSDEIMPLVRERLLKGFKVKNCGGLFARDKTEIDSIINVYRNNTFSQNFRIHQVMLTNSGSNISINVKGSYRTGEFSCNYIDHNFYIAETDGQVFDYEPMKQLNFNDVLKAKARVEEIADQIRELEREKRKLAFDNELL